MVNSKKKTLKKNIKAVVLKNKGKKVVKVNKKTMQKFKNIDKGIILTLKDSIAEVRGLKSVQAGELVKAKANFGLVLNLYKRKCGVVFFSDLHLKVGDIVSKTSELASLHVSISSLGNVISALGYNVKLNYLTNVKPLIFFVNLKRLIEIKAPGILKRQSVYETLNLGIKIVDSAIPYGRGQRSLALGDRQLGKTAIAVDAILNAKYIF